MDKMVWSLVLMAAFAGTALSADLPHSGDLVLWTGGGGYSPLDRGAAYTCWSEQPNLDGILFSSEIIGDRGWNSEVANDCLLCAGPEGLFITVIRWWGGYFDGAGPSVISFYLRFYDDEDNRPGELSLEILVPHNCHETFLHEQQGGGHVYGYEFMLRNPISVPSEVPFWFSVQTGGDTYPPQWGRLGGINVINNGSMFRDDYVSYTDWTPCSVVLGEEYDAAQEFVCLTPSGIEEPDLPTLRHISWANIKALYR